MKLYILRPKENLSESNDPWNPWYDKSFGFVVRAETPKKARKIAHENAGDENRGAFLGMQISTTNSPWIDPNFSTCRQLKTEGKSGLVIQDVYSA